MDTKDYVLEKLSIKERNHLKPTIEKAADAVLDYFHTPFQELMSKYNVKIKK